MERNYYLLTNLLSDEELRIVTSMVAHIEQGKNKVGIQQIAKENYVSSTFIIKMCKRLGFDGYSELYYYLSKKTGPGRPGADREELYRLIDNYDEEKGDLFCRLLTSFRDRKIFVEGNGFSALVTDYMVQRLAVCGFMSFNSVLFYDFMIFRGPHSRTNTNVEPTLMIAISQSGETMSIINDVEKAKKRGFSIICFTKRSDSTLASLSDLVFVVDGAKQTLVGEVPNLFFGHVILAFEELMGRFLDAEPVGHLSKK